MKVLRIILLALFVFCLQLFVPQTTFAQGTSCTEITCASAQNESKCWANHCLLNGVWQQLCMCITCPCAGCQGTYCDCCGCSSASCGAGCFTGETGIQLKTEDSKPETKEIKDLKPGDIVSSFDPETGEVKEGTVSDVTKTTREGYYILKTESGKEVRVTAEHPFLAIKSEKNPSSAEASEGRQASSSKLQLIDKLKNIFSHTLTYKLITGLQAKVSGMLR